MAGVEQPTLDGFGPEALARPAPRRIALDAGGRSWVDHVPEWVDGADALFAELLDHAPWRRATIAMRGVQRPMNRLSAWWDDGAGPPRLAELAAALGRRYGVPFAARGVNLYRDGADTVGWHRDRIPKRAETFVATISLGAPRRFVLRPHDGPPERRRERIRVDVASGDLLVMGGFCQRDFEHTVPRDAKVRAPRISITLRHWPGMPADLPDLGLLRDAAGPTTIAPDAH